MERALYIKDICKINDEELRTIRRVYFGTEFCEHLIPTWNKIQEVIDFCKTSHLDFSFVTPLVTDKGIELIENIFDKLNQEPKINNKNYEVIINDYGVILSIQRFANLMPVIGRLLSKQKRDPRIVTLQSNLHTENSDLGHSQFSQPFLSYLEKKNVRRIEVDNLLQGISDDFTSCSFDVSVYYPFTYLTTTRLCLFNQRHDYEVKDVIPCAKRECQNQGVFELTNSHFSVPILLKGNTQFFENTKLPENLEKRGINRIVYEKEIPI